MEISGREKLIVSGCKPVFTVRGMAERTGAVSTGMIDVVDFFAGRTFVNMPPELSGSAGSQAVYGPTMIWRDFPAKSLEIGRAMDAKDFTDSCHGRSIENS